MQTQTPRQTPTQSPWASDQPEGVDTDLAAKRLLAALYSDLGWQERALCAQTDPEQFFPEKGGSTREAKRICGRCEVRAECLDAALANDERYGIWGGSSERERRNIQRLETTQTTQQTSQQAHDTDTNTETVQITVREEDAA